MSMICGCRGVPFPGERHPCTNDTVVSPNYLAEHRADRRRIQGHEL
jgi:hypothetical protein